MTLAGLPGRKLPCSKPGQGCQYRFPRSRRRPISGSGAKGCAGESLRRYPALLVSLHADTIYGRYFDAATANPEDAAAVRAFLDEQHEVQARLAASLRADPEYGEQASPENIARNQRLIAALDWMSLAICWGVEKEEKIPDVPMEGEGKAELSFRFRDRQNLVLDPWPFRQTRIAVRAEGKRLRGRFSTQKSFSRR